MTPSIDDATRAQIDALDLNRSRPAVICDVDEVVLQFLTRLEQHLGDHGCWLDRSSYALNGNIRRHGSNEPVATDEIGTLLFGFFDRHTETLDPIEGAIEGLEALSGDADIVLLTNLPHRYGDARVRNLVSHGVMYPVVANNGPKGPAVDLILEAHEAPAVFLDDSPKNLESVISHRPDVASIHFIADEGFARVTPEVEGIALRTGTWPEAVSFIKAHLGA